MVGGCLALFMLQSNTLAAEPDWEQRRIVAWRALVATHQSDTEKAKIRWVNEFINQMQYAEDRIKWGKQDYWATPREFVTTNGGDCEDFAIAKYFTLVAMGIPESRLKLVYALTVPQGQPHMVLYYYPDETSKTPLVLDNQANTIRAAGSRVDLRPVYSFNSHSYWLNSADGGQVYIGTADRLSRWNSLLRRRENSG